jgi:D-alanyl-D-alanine carboxypeptidase
MKVFAALVAFCTILSSPGLLRKIALPPMLPDGKAISTGIPDSIKLSIDTIVYSVARSKTSRMICKVTGARGDTYYSGFDGRSKQPIREFSRTIDIGSCTKMFTAASILQLVEQRKISLDDPLTRVLPEPSLYQGLSVFDGKDYIDSITIRQLMNHTSGFADYFMGDDKTEISLHGDSTLRFTPRQLIRLAARINKPKFRPGTSFGYSNVNYLLLGMIIEKYSGLAYHAYVQRNILDPLHMKHTYFASVNSPAGRAPGHYSGKPTEMPATMAGAAGEIISTLDDMQIFISAWHQGKIFRQPATMALLRSADFHDMGGGILYGLGVVKLIGLSLGHAGQTFGFSAYMGVLPNGNSFVFGIDDAAVSAWTPAVALSALLGGRE